MITGGPSKANRRIPGRSFFIFFACIILWGILIIRLFNLQILSYEYYQGKVINNIQRETTLTADRGVIYDRDMVTLASNYTVYRIFISPRAIIAADQSAIADEDELAKSEGRAPSYPEKTYAQLVSEGLSQILGKDYGVTYDFVYEKAQKANRADETIVKKADEDVTNLIREFIESNKGTEKMIYIEANSARYYPFSSVASNVIGFVGTDGGLLGLELKYNSFLSGKSGKYITARDSTGLSMPYKYDNYIDASNGANLVTTLNLTIQKSLEKQLKQTYEDSGPLNRVTGIVMDPNTGAIYAMGTYPSFDCNDPFTLDEDSQKKLAECGYPKDSDEYSTYYYELLNAMWKNKAVSELYEPGSTSKIITTAMALEEGAASFDDQFTCTGEYFVEGYDQPIHCHKRSGHGTHPYSYMLQQSCNPTLMQVASRIGRLTFYKYFQDFGYTTKTGIDLPGEAAPIYSSYSNFLNVELAVYSFGQTYKVTPIQQLTAISTIANGGHLITPYVVDQIIDDDGNVLMQHETEVKRQVVSTEVCNMITTVLEDGVAGNGGAKNAYVAGYRIAAKTGTSEVRDILDENGQSYLRIGSCVAYAPAENPQVAAIIIVDQPQCANVYGSVVAAPYVANLMSEVLPYLGIEPSYSDTELEKVTVSVRSYVGWSLEETKKALENSNIKYEVKGDGDIVTHQIPGRGEQMIKNGSKVIIYTGNEVPTYTIAAPNVVGYTASQANRAIVNRKLNIVIEGAINTSGTAEASVVSQSPAAGTMLSEGDVVTITLRYLDDQTN